MAQLIHEIEEQTGILQKLCEIHPEGIQTEAKNKNLYLIGTGASLNACFQAKYALTELLDTNIIVVPAYEAEYYLNIFDKEAIIIIISQSGESFETRLVCDWLMEKKLEFHGITNNPESYLAKKANRAFLLESGVELGTSTKTQTSSVFLLYLMAAAGHETAMAEVKKIPKYLQRTIDTAKDYIADFSSFLGEAEVVYITGNGQHTPTAEQAGLMMKEKVFLNAEGLSLVEFRHGPVEALNTNIPVVIITYGEENMSKACVHAEFLQNICGVRVCFISDSPLTMVNGIRNFSFCWEGSEAFSHICATVPFQLMVEHLAKKRGYDIDGFKFIGKILNKY
jgi:glutamine---fructose-6-phosphate transaminase (isomerizing)